MHKVVNEILESNEWRDGEFAMFKVNKQNVDQTLWCRMCVPMIYAHWEGFVVSSLRLVLEYLNSLNLNPNDLQTKLVVVGLGDSYRSLSGKQSFEQRIVFTDKFKGIYSGTIEFTQKVDTKSNLKSKVLKDLCEMFGFDFYKFKDCETIIDRLVNVRNSIAHGENSIVVNNENITDYIKKVNEAMDLLINEIDHFLCTESYLNKNAA